MRITLLISLLLLSSPAWAQFIPTEGEVYESISYDLNGDGKAEKIGLLAYNVGSENFWAQLQVMDANGKVIWQGPQADKIEQPFAFGMWPFGASGIEWLGDIDGDGKADLLSPAPGSGDRPPTYRRFQWNGQAFEAPTSHMLLESPAGSGKFLWQAPIQWDNVKPLTWVMSLREGPSQKVAGILSYRADGTYWMGEATMNGNASGLTIDKWTEKMAPRE